MEKQLVSIVMPLYNNERYVAETIASILSQTYTNWELIIVDDCSKDSSLNVAKSICANDPRIKIIEHAANLGAASARNTGLRYVSGRYLMFMDSDDLWDVDKIKKQCQFMASNHYSMSFTSYETITANGQHRNYVHVPKTISYSGFLKNTITCSHTICFDLSKIQIELLTCPDCYDFDFPDDMAVWLRVLNSGISAHGLDLILAKNRKHSESRSASKVSAINRTWNQYRKIEKLSFPYSAYCLFWQLFHAVLKRI